MANYATLKTAIEAVIKTNGNNEITGSILQQSLLAMINSLGAEYQFKGVATPDTDPGTPDYNVIYVAATTGTYVNFDNKKIDGGIWLFKYNGSWVSERISDIVDSLQSSDVDGLLSANQGRLLKEELDTIGYQFNNVALTSYISARVSAYISATTGLWASSSATQTFFVPVKAGEKYRIQAKTTNAARYAVVRDNTHTIGATPNYSVEDTGLHIVSAGKYSDVIIPEDAAYLAVNYSVSGTVVTPTIYIVSPYAQMLMDAIEHFKVREINVVLTASQRIDCRTTSVNFGKVVAAPNETWGTSQLIDITDARIIRFYGSLLNSNGNYQGWTGLCFYDVSGNAMQAGLYVIQPSIVNVNGWWDIFVPDGAKYLRYTALLTTQSVNRPVKLYVLAPNDIYNPNDISILPNRYEGEKIHLDKYAYRWMTFAGNALGGQSAAIFGDYVFIVQEYVAKIGCYNIRTRKLLYTLTTEITAPSYWHCNQSQFGNLRYADDDMFPLLYVAMQDDDNNRGSWVAFRIIPVITDGEISSFTIAQVQTIHLPVMTDENCMGHPNIAFDALNNCFWAYHRNNNSAATNYRKAHFSKFAIPAIWNGSVLVSDVDLTDADILDSFEDDWSMLYAQGGFILDGKLYIAQGMPSANYIYMRVVDLYVKRKMVTIVDLLRAGISIEPEGLFYYDGNIFITTGSARILRLQFE